MKIIINPEKLKFVVLLVAALASFFGLAAAAQALQYNQIGTFFKVAFYVYLFLVFWESFIFDLHLKPAASLARFEKTFLAAVKERFAYLAKGTHWLHFQNFLVLPGIVYWSTIAVIYLNPFDEVTKLVWIILTTLVLSVSFWYMKTIFTRHEEANHQTKLLIFFAKLYASYLAFIASFGVSRHFDYGPYWFGLVVFLITFLLMYQALFQHHVVGFAMLKFLLATAFALGILAQPVYLFWNVNFYSGAIVLASVYNTIWGLVHHQYIDHDITREIVYEYLAMLVLVLVVVFSMTNFAERI